MPLFPPAPPVTVLIDGRPLPEYVRAYVAGGRVFAPVDPLLTRLADRLWTADGWLVAERDGRRVRVRLEPSFHGQLDAAYFPAGPALRALGVAVRYEPELRRLTVVLPARAAIASPSPFEAAAPSVAPSSVFTPAPPQTPRPIWTGTPLPRRTALPLPPPREEISNS
ncbi:MAG TPA: hypothetical protein VEW74_07085 [Candidatus Nitrosotalea sp.]|nr:hypothetical protein [Candidatus Nitrosotalea sp.]